MSLEPEFNLMGEVKCPLNQMVLYVGITELMIPLVEPQFSLM